MLVSRHAVRLDDLALGLAVAGDRPDQAVRADLGVRVLRNERAALLAGGDDRPVHLVELAQAATLTTLCVERAGRAAAIAAASLEIVATKSVANRHAGVAVRAAHQAHGAIGMAFGVISTTAMSQFRR